MKVIGLDLSLTATGVAGAGWADTLTPPPAPKRNAAWKRLTDPERDLATRAYQHERLQWILVKLADWIPHPDDEPCLVVLEGLSFDSHDTARQSAGLSWMVRHSLWRDGVPYVLVPPSSLKLYATGSGNAGKEQMLAAARRHFDWFDGDDNAADAAWLAAMGYDALDRPVAVPNHGYRHRAMGGAFWPVLDALRPPAVVDVPLPEDDVVPEAVGVVEEMPVAGRQPGGLRVAPFVVMQHIGGAA